MKRAVLAIGGAAVLLAAPAAGEPVVLTPTSDWLVNYADDSCRLGRVFGEGEARTVLMMDRFAPSDSFQLAVASKLLTRTMARDTGSREVMIRFGPGEAEQSEPMMPATVDDLPALLGNEVMLGVRADEAAHQAELAAAKAVGDKAKIKALEVLVPAMPMTPEREASVTYLEIRGAAKDPITLKLGKMDKPMAALRTCIDELLTHWGVDPEAHRSLSRSAAPRGAPGKWLTHEDYPSNLVAKGVQGLIQFRLAVEPDGSVSDCAIQQSTRPAEFDRTVCRIMMRRARFEPALDAKGHPIKSYWRSSVRFLIH